MIVVVNEQQVEVDEQTTIAARRWIRWASGTVGYRCGAESSVLTPIGLGHHPELRKAGATRRW